jgi:hypothetical protein
MIESKNERTRLVALIEEEVDSVWLFLVGAAGEGILAHCWLYNTTSEPLLPSWEEYRERSAPPPAPKLLILDGSVLLRAESPGWTISWSGDGQSVAALHDGVPMGFIIGGSSKGYSKYIRKSSAWGEPWSSDKYLEIFGTEG